MRERERNKSKERKRLRIKEQEKERNVRTREREIKTQLICFLFLFKMSALDVEYVTIIYNKQLYLLFIWMSNDIASVVKNQILMVNFYKFKFDFTNRALGIQK